MSRPPVVLLETPVQLCALARSAPAKNKTTMARSHLNRQIRRKSIRMTIAVLLPSQNTELKYTPAFVARITIFYTKYHTV
jgi:hypothetical protein